MTDAAGRLILHVDLDAFYASVEQLDNPELRGRPVVVGGLGGRGVVSAASYEARRFGVHSAMPVSQARRLCPDASFVPSRMDRYRELSARVFACFRDLTPDVEGLSLDEAFLDLSADPAARRDPERMAQALRERIRREIGLVASVGIAPNKFVAKLASDLGKPDGLVHVRPDRLHAFLDPLPVDRLWGVGKPTTDRLRRAGMATLGSLRRAPEPRVRGIVGRQAPRLRALAAGEDNRPVQARRAARSVSTERTFSQDLTTRQALEHNLADMAERVAARLRDKQLEAGTVVVKLRTRDFTTHTRQQHLDRPAANGAIFYRTALDLAQAWWQEQPSTVRLRLVGLGTRDLVPATGQMGLFAVNEKTTASDRLLDDARRRFGEGVLRRGRATDSGGGKR